MRILVVEDNHELAELIQEALESVGFSVDLAGEAEEARLAVRTRRYAAMVLDLGLPDDDGLSVLAEMRGRSDSTPVLVLTARALVGDRVAGLNAGADDYLVKPFDFEELTARLGALLRRPGEMLGQTLTVGDLTFDAVGRQVFIRGEPKAFSARDLDLLEVLMRRNGRVVLKQHVEDHLFGMNTEVGSNAVEVQVHRLRKRLEPLQVRAEIHTIRGVGYMLSETS